MFEHCVLSFLSGLITVLISFTFCVVCVLSMGPNSNCGGVLIDFHIYVK